MDKTISDVAAACHFVDNLHAPFTLRSWNVASLLVGDGLVAHTVSRHQSKMGFAQCAWRVPHTWLHARGCASDISELGGGLSSKDALGSFTVEGKSGGIALLLAQALLVVVLGRVAAQRMRGLLVVSLDFCNLHLIPNVELSDRRRSCAGLSLRSLRFGRRSLWR